MPAAQGNLAGLSGIVFHVLAGVPHRGRSPFLEALDSRSLFSRIAEDHRRKPPISREI